MVRKTRNDSDTAFALGKLMQIIYDDRNDLTWTRCIHETWVEKCVVADPQQRGEIFWHRLIERVRKSMINDLSRLWS